MISLNALKSALKSYEDKNYKKCIKICDENQNLNDVTGDLLCLKGISLHSLGKIDQGYEFIKKGLQVSLRSGLGWHLYAIMLKSDKKYIEASKAFKSAIKLDSSNQSLLKELSLLLMHLRDKTGFLDMRLDILSSNSTIFLNLSAVAYGLLLLREYIPFLLITKSVIILSENSNYFPAFPCIANSNSFITPNCSTSGESFFSYDVHRSAPGITSQVQDMCNLNMLDAALTLLKASEDYEQQDRNLRLLYIKILGLKSFQDPSHFTSWIFLLEDMFKPEKTSVEGLVEKLLSIQALEYINLLGRLYLSQENIDLAHNLYLKSLDQIFDASEDTFDFGNYCFRRSTINSCFAMQHVVHSSISSNIFSQLLEGYLYSSILSLRMDRSKLKDITENLKRFLAKIMQFSCNSLSFRCEFLMICFFYVSELFILMRHHMLRYRKAIEPTDPVESFNSYILHTSQTHSEILYEFVSVIPSNVVEKNLSLFIQSASDLKAKSPLVYANTERLISLYTSSSLKNLLNINNL